jgi:hypothetical protein
MTDTDLFGDSVRPRQAIGSHQAAASSSGTDEWLTPPELIAALGTFDLDPCSPGLRRPWDTARLHYGAEDNGLRQPWAGRIWLNPPYSNAGAWLARLAEHGTGTALIFARTETRIWHEHVWPKASGILFLRGRITFRHVDGRPAQANSGAPSALIAYGADDLQALTESGLVGALTCHSRMTQPRHSPVTQTPVDNPS